MEIPYVVYKHYTFLLPVALVIVCALLVFAFGFKSSVEPPSFKQLGFSSDDRKSVKKKKLKDKKPQSTNGHATLVTDDGEGKKVEQASKTLKQSNKADPGKTKEVEKVKEKKGDVQKSPAKKAEKKVGKENQVDAKNKRNALKNEAKPTDFDEGEWETAFSRKDKKNRKKEDDIMAIITPEKTPKKKVESGGGDKQSLPEVTEASAKAEAPAKAEVAKEAVEAPIIVAAVEKPEAAEEPAAKKKKAKKAKGAEEIIKEVEEVKTDPVESKESERLNEKNSVSEQPVSGAVFDELGDVWKDAPQKKSKKKARKD